jgi:hypothetical protein
MSRAALLLVLPILVACSKKDTATVDSSAAMVADTAPSAAAAPNVAGKWSVKVMPEGNDSTLLIYMLDATNTTSGWKMTLPNREPMDIRVIHMDNDSIVVENGPYSSALQKNVMVTTHSNMHLDGDKIVGTTIAHYDKKGADSVRVLRTEGTRQ